MPPDACDRLLDIFAGDDAAADISGCLKSFGTAFESDDDDDDEDDEDESDSVPFNEPFVEAVGAPFLGDFRTVAVDAVGGEVEFVVAEFVASVGDKGAAAAAAFAGRRPRRVFIVIIAAATAMICVCVCVCCERHRAAQQMDRSMKSGIWLGSVNGCQTYGVYVQYCAWIKLTWGQEN